MSKAITCFVPDRRIAEFPHPFEEMFLLAAVRESGIPVQGIFYFDGITSGTLTWNYDVQTQGYVYRWTEELP